MRLVNRTYAEHTAIIKTLEQTVAILVAWGERRVRGTALSAHCVALLHFTSIDMRYIWLVTIKGLTASGVFRKRQVPGRCGIGIGHGLASTVVAETTRKSKEIRITVEGGKSLGPQLAEALSDFVNGLHDAYKAFSSACHVHMVYRWQVTTT